MNKQEKLNKITELENELQKLKIEVEKENNDYSWENCFQKDGYYLSLISGIKRDVISNPSAESKNVFRTEKEAKSALAMAQLSHIIYVANDCEELDWTDSSSKYTIERHRNEINCMNREYTYYFLAFKSSEIMKQVLEQNEQLIKNYLMID